MILVLIFVNAVLIAVESGWSVQSSFDSYDAALRGEVLADSTPVWLKQADTTFVSIFFVELVLRLLAHEGLFFVGPAWKWNLFDFIVICLGVVEIFFGGVGRPDTGEIAPHREDQSISPDTSSVTLRTFDVSTSSVVVVVQKFVGSAVLVQRVARPFHRSLRNYFRRRCQVVRGHCYANRPEGGSNTRSLRNPADGHVVSSLVRAR